MNIIERKLQQTQVFQVEKWADLNGFKFSQDKTKVIHFCHKCKLHLDLILYLNKQLISVTKEIKFLGVIFDNKLHFKAHIDYLKNKCLKSLNILKIVAHKNGEQIKRLLTLYRTLIRSKIDYGSIVYGSTQKSYILDPIVNQAL